MRSSTRTLTVLFSATTVMSSLAVGAAAATSPPAPTSAFSPGAATVAEGTQPSTASPALVSTNPTPTVVAGVTVPTPARVGFRVLPYLQAPGAERMRINFFPETGTPATVSVRGPAYPWTA